jgi:hypothetical protein
MSWFGCCGEEKNVLLRRESNPSADPSILHPPNMILRAGTTPAECYWTLSTAVVQLETVLAWPQRSTIVSRERQSLCSQSYGRKVPCDKHWVSHRTKNMRNCDENIRELLISSLLTSPWEAGDNTSTVIPASRKRRRKGNPVVSDETLVYG